MLKHLTLHHFILFEEGHLDLAEGFTVISGETGSGKSALLKALRLVMGDAADTKQIRQGADKAVIEAAFDISGLPHVIELLNESGIAHDAAEWMVIRRLLSASGKSRAFINGQMISRAFLQQLGRHLIDFVGQHANQQLLDLHYHRQLLDLYGGLESDLSTYRQTFRHLCELQNEHQEITTQEAQRLRDTERYRTELTELQEAELQEDEEEELFQEYSRLSHAEELLHEVTSLLQGLEESLLPKLRHMLTQIHKLVKIDLSLKSHSPAIETATAELDELTFELNRYRQTLEFHPDRLSFLEQRLRHYADLKRKYGATFQEITAYQTKIEGQLQQLEGAEDRLSELEQELRQTQHRCDQQAAKLTQKRTSMAKQLAQAVEVHFPQLNLPGAQLEFRLTPQTRTVHGDDRVELFFAPNVGERRVPLRESASGGELSRVLLALKTVLAGLECTPTLMFDEIDANIGGATATLVAEKMQAIATKRQVLCITHLPQVASHASHHIAVSKQTSNGRTVTTLTPLTPEQREAELLRMAGKRVPILTG